MNGTGVVEVGDSNCLNEYTAVGPKGSQADYLYDESYQYYYDCGSRLTDVNYKDASPLEGLCDRQTVEKREPPSSRVRYVGVSEIGFDWVCFHGG